MIQRKSMTSILTCNIWELYSIHIIGKTDDIFEIMRKFWVRNLCCRAKILILKFELLLPDLDLTSKVGKLWWRYKVITTITCKKPRKTCVARHACDFHFLVNFWDLTLILAFSGMAFVLTQYPSQTFTSTFCEFQPFAVRLTDPTAQKVKTVFFTWPDLDLKRDHYLKMLNMH